MLASSSCMRRFIFALVRVEVDKVPEALHEQDEPGPHARCRLKIGRRSLGSVNTYCQCATGARTFCSTGRRIRPDCAVPPHGALRIAKAGSRAGCAGDGARPRVR
jgi:hypothetical protein